MFFGRITMPRKLGLKIKEGRTDEHEADFSMELTKDKKAAKARIWDCVKSPSIWLFYPAMIAILGAVMYMRLKGVV